MPSQSTRQGHHKTGRHRFPVRVYLQDSFSEESFEYVWVPIIIISNLQTCSNLSSGKRNNQQQPTTKSHVLGMGMLLLVVAPRFLFFHLRSLGTAPPVAPVLRSPSGDADSSASAHLRVFPFLLPRGRHLPLQPPANEMLQQSRQIILSVRVLPRSCYLHLPSGLCLPVDSLTLARLFSSCAVSAKRTHRFSLMPSFAGVVLLGARHCVVALSATILV